MSEGGEKIRISAEDIRDPKVDEAIRLEKLRIALPAADEGPSPAERKKAAKQYPPLTPAPQPAAAAAPQGFSVIASSPLYTALAGVAGAAAAWALTEAVLPPSDVTSPGLILAHSVVWFALVGALVGAAIGSAEGIVSRSPNQAVRGGCVSLLLGAAGCGIGAAAAQEVYFVAYDAVAASFAFAMISRAFAWGIAGMALGLAQGIAMGSARKTLHGLLGGVIGGAVGGLLFDPIGLALGGIREGLFSRLAGLVVLGAAVGGMMGIVEEMLKDAWLKVEQGALAGKQFVIYRNPTFIGSSPKCHIYLFKDPAIEPRHAAIHTVANGYEVEDLRSAQGTFVNHQPVSRQRLNNGDRIRIGKTVFEYSERKKGGR